MADFETVLDTLARVRRACRPSYAMDPAGGVRVSPHQARILAFLDERDPAMVGELAEHLGVTASTMSLTLTRLERAGYVRRDRDPLDRRVMNVRLSPAGVRVRDQSRELDPQRVEGMLSLMTPSERSEVLRALGLLADASDRLVRREAEAVAAQL